MKYLINSKTRNKRTCSIFIKVCLIGVLINLSGVSANGQSSLDTTKQARKTTYLLPDGSLFSLNKWDSLEQAWGKGRIRLQHSQEDDAKGIVHLVRLTDEMLQMEASRDKENEQALAALLNKPAPDFELIDLNGKPWSLRHLGGKVVVLNFWFTSCTPCIAEIPELNKLVASYYNREVVFLGLTFNRKDQVQQFLKKYKFEYTLLYDSQRVDESYHITSWPTSIVIDKKGIIKKIVHSDPKIAETMTDAINALL